MYLHISNDRVSQAAYMYNKIQGVAKIDSNILTAVS